MHLAYPRDVRCCLLSFAPDRPGAGRIGSFGAQMALDDGWLIYARLLTGGPDRESTFLRG